MTAEERTTSVSDRPSDPNTGPGPARSRALHLFRDEE